MKMTGHQRETVLKAQNEALTEKQMDFTQYVPYHMQVVNSVAINTDTYLTCSAVFLICFPPDTTEYPKSSHLYTAISRSMKVAFLLPKLKSKEEPNVH